jgi:hypothetical protein
MDSIRQREALRAFLRCARAALSPEEVGLPPRAEGRGRRAVGLSQEQVDELMNRAAGTYARLERGSLYGVTPELCRDVALALRFAEEQWQALWIYMYGHLPPWLLHPSQAGLVGGHWRRVVEMHGEPAYVTDAGWNIIYHNHLFAAIFPGRVAPANAMEWMMLSADARHRLVDWPRAWAPKVLPQLRAAVLEHPENETLQWLDRAVRRDPVAGRLYGETHDAHLQPDGDVRQLVHAGRGDRQVVQMAAAEPTGKRGARFMVLQLDPVVGDRTFADVM